mgnify:CR=1 FL=1
MIKKTIVVFLVVILIGSIAIIKTQDLNIKDSNDQMTLLKSVGNWVIQIFSNLKSVTAYVIQQDWKPQSEENTTSSS